MTRNQLTWSTVFTVLALISVSFPILGIARYYGLNYHPTLFYFTSAILYTVGLVIESPVKDNKTKRWSLWDSIRVLLVVIIAGLIFGSAFNDSIQDTLHLVQGFFKNNIVRTIIGILLIIASVYDFKRKYKIYRDSNV